MLRSEEIGEIATALAKARGQFEDLKKNRTAKIVGRDENKASYTYKYETLADVFDVVDKPLSDNGLSVVQTVVDQEGAPGRMILQTTLLHASGQWLAGRVPLPVAANAPPQAFGSALTYMRRYCLEGLLGIAGDNDDDGAAGGQGPRAPAQRPAQAPQQRPQSPARPAAPVAPQAAAEPPAREPPAREPGDENETTTISPDAPIGDQILALYRQRLDNAASQADVSAIAAEARDQLTPETYDTFRAESVMAFKRLKGAA
jgi:hypothetical protein